MVTLDFTIAGSTEDFDHQAQEIFKEGLVVVLAAQGATKENIELTVRPASVIVTAEIVLPNADLANDAVVTLATTPAQQISNAVAQTVESVSSPAVIIFDAAEAQPITAVGETADSGVWITIIIVLIVFNITTCLCCALKRNSWTMVSSRRDFIALVQGLPADAASCIHLIGPCILTPAVWLAWTACCCKGCGIATAKYIFGARAQVAPELDDIYEEPKLTLKSLKFSQAFMLKPDPEPEPEGPSKPGLKALGAGAFLGRQATKKTALKPGLKALGAGAFLARQATKKPSTKPGLKTLGTGAFLASQAMRSRTNVDEPEAAEETPEEATRVTKPGLKGVGAGAVLARALAPEGAEAPALDTPEEATRVTKPGLKAVGAGAVLARTLAPEGVEAPESTEDTLDAAEGADAPEGSSEETSQAAGRPRLKTLGTGAVLTRQTAKKEPEQSRKRGLKTVGVGAILARQATKEKAEDEAPQRRAPTLKTIRAARVLLSKPAAKGEAPKKVTGFAMLKAVAKIAARRDAAAIEDAAIEEAARRQEEADKEDDPAELSESDEEEGSSGQDFSTAAFPRDQLVALEASVEDDGKVSLGFGYGLKFQKDDAATQMQKHARGKKGKKAKKQKQKEHQEHLEQVDAATKVQTKARGNKAKKAKAALVEEKVKENDAATTLQSSVRMKKAKSEKAVLVHEKLENDSATKVQAAARSKKAKKKTEGLKQEKQAKKEDDAATKLQSGVRMKKAKSQKAVLVQEKKEDDAALRIQGWLHVKEAMRQRGILAQEKVENDAALVLQGHALIVRAKAYKEVLKQERKEDEAATAVQKHARKKKAKKDVEKQKIKVKEDAEKAVVAKIEGDAATVVQKHVRVKKAKSDVVAAKQAKVENEAATVVQANVRVAKAKSQKNLLAAEKALPAKERKERSEAAGAIQQKMREKKEAKKAELAQEVSKLQTEEEALSEEEKAARAAAATKIQSKKRVQDAKAQVAEKQKAKPNPKGNGAKEAARAKGRAEQEQVRKQLESKIAVVEKKREDKEQAAAATKVQQGVRMKKAKSERDIRVKEKKVREDQAAAAKRAEEKRENDAATMLQSQVRVRTAKAEKAQRALDKAENEAATVVQARVRGAAAKKERDARAHEKQEREETAAATALQSAARVRDAKAQRAALKQERDEANAAVVVQSRTRVRRAQSQRSLLAAEKQQAVDREQNEAAIKVQSRVRVHRAKSDLQLKKDERDNAESKAATTVQSSIRARAARQQVDMIRQERQMPEEEQRARAEAATKLAAAKRGHQARHDLEVRRRERAKLEADKREAAKAIKTLIRIRQARQQRKLLQEAAELASMLGISKWAALWMLRNPDVDKREAREVADDETEKEPEPSGLWGKLASVEDVEPPAVSSPASEYPPSSHGDYPPSEGGLDGGPSSVLDGGPSSVLDGGPSTIDGGTSSIVADAELGAIDDHALRGGILAGLLDGGEDFDEGPLLQAPEYKAPPPAVAQTPPRTPPNPHWQLLANNLGRAVRAIRAAEGRTVTIADDSATAVARAAMMRAEQLREFRRMNPNYPHGPGVQTLLSQPGATGRRSPRDSRNRPISQGRPARQATGIAKSRSAASLLDRPASAGIDAPGARAAQRGLCGQPLPLYGDTQPPSFAAAGRTALAVSGQPRPRPGRPPVAAWGAEPVSNDTGPRSALAPPAVRQRPTLDAGDAPQPVTSPSMPILPAAAASRLGGARRRGERSPQRRSPPRQGTQRQLRTIQRKESNERLATRADRRAPRMPGAQAVAAPSQDALANSLEAEAALRSSAPQGELEPPAAAQAAPTTGPARTLRTSNSQMELRQLARAPSGEIRAGPSLLSEMPLPFDMGGMVSPRGMPDRSALGPGMSPRLPAGLDRSSFVQQPPGRAAPRPGAPAGAANQASPFAAARGVLLTVPPRPPADTGPAYGDRVMRQGGAQPSRAAREQRTATTVVTAAARLRQGGNSPGRRGDNSPPRRYQI